jgi:hypothetical protein
MAKEPVHVPYFRFVKLLLNGFVLPWYHGCYRGALIRKLIVGARLDLDFEDNASSHFLDSNKAVREMKFAPFLSLLSFLSFLSFFLVFLF